jgi:hypothetical protein
MKNKEQIAREYGILSRKDADFDSAILNAMEEYYQQSYANGDYCSVCGSSDLIINSDLKINDEE